MTSISDRNNMRMVQDVVFFIRDTVPTYDSCAIYAKRRTKCERACSLTASVCSVSRLEDGFVVANLNVKIIRALVNVQSRKIETRPQQQIVTTWILKNAFSLSFYRILRFYFEIFPSLSLFSPCLFSFCSVLRAVAS